MSVQSFRHWVDFLRKQGQLKTAVRSVDRRFEAAAVIKKMDGRAAVLFPRVEGSDIPLVSGILFNRDMIAEAMDTAVDQIMQRLVRALASPRSCRVLPPEVAPVKEVILEGDEIDLTGLFPIPVHHTRDAGAYITAGVVIAADPDSDWVNLSIHRLQVQGPRHLGVLILPRHLWYMFQKAEDKGQHLPVAIAIGVDPLVLIASQIAAPVGVNEMEIASSLHSDPLETVLCNSSDLAVPAHSEIVLEGRLLPGIRESEGPFGEFPRYYGPRKPRPVIEIDLITHRKNPFYHTIVPATREHFLLGSVPREAALVETLRRVVPTVKEVHLTYGGVSRYHAVVALDKKNEGEAKTVILTALACHADIKHVVVVDGEINPFEPEDVEWAIATRFQADRDLIVVPGMPGSHLDPSTVDGVTCKMGLDATIPLKAPPEKYEHITIPGLEQIAPDTYF